jgi:hypothetical protein
MHHLRLIHRFTVPAALAAVGLALSAIPAAADGDKPRRAFDVEIRQGTLEIVGSSSDDELALRLKAGKPEKLEIDAGDDRRGRLPREAAQVRAHRHRDAAAPTASGSTSPTARSPTRSRRRSTAARATTRSVAVAAQRR